MNTANPYCPACGTYGIHYCTGGPSATVTVSYPPPDWNRITTAFERLVSVLERLVDDRYQRNE